MIWIFNPITLLLVYIAYSKCSKGSVPYYIAVLIGVPIDFVVNVTWFSVIFWELPKEWLLTKRVSRLKVKDGYRGKLAGLICKLLNYFQPEHCK
jgi:hypothetical protein